MVADMDEYVASLNTEVGFPCIHRRQKQYIVPNENEKLNSWPLVFKNYEIFKGKVTVDCRKMTENTFYKYVYSG